MKGRYTKEQLETIMKIKKQCDAREEDFSLDNEAYCLTAAKLTKNKEQNQNNKQKNKKKNSSNQITY